ncbi:MAG: lipocalin-like domain-containing protein [Alphaproteobacteria bacterium]|nr:lipocalin-like domain-containing protein [Alphaproteobacteria bacterium]
MTAVGQQLIGTWRLVSWLRIESDGKRTEPLGPGSTGLITYTADGFMFAALMAPGRKPFAGTDPFGGAAEECHRAMSTGLSYCGRWRLDGDTLVHAVEMSMFPNWVGIEMVRTCRFEGDRAVVRTPPVDNNGVSVVFELVLRRAA